MERKITISYWWKCDKLGFIPRELQEALAESAESRIAEMMKEGYIQGELQDNVNMKIDGKRTPEDGWECSGSWQADRAFASVNPKAITKPYTKKEARKLVKNNVLTAIIKLSFDDIMMGKDGLNDLVSVMVCGNEAAMEGIDYSFVGGINNQNENSVLVQVSGDIENWLAGKAS